MNDKIAKSPLPPYLSWKTFYNYVQSLKQTMLDQIDPSGMLTLSGTNRNLVMNALKFFRLINENGQPQPTLRAWVDYMVSGNKTEEQKVMRQILESAYPTFFQGFNLKGASPASLSAKFKALELGEGTARKSETFFIEAAKAAGIPVSDVILATRKKGRKVGSVNAPRKPMLRNKQYQPEDDNEVDNPPSGWLELSKWYETFKPAFDKLPSFDKAHWSITERERWISLVTALVDAYVEIDDGKKKT